MAEPRPPRALAAILVVLVVVAGGGGFAFLYYENHKSPSPGGTRVALGDNVTVAYIGLFGSGPQIGRVFDTSLYSVATNNLSWQKSLEYTWRGPNPANYTPLPVYVGPYAPSGGYTIGNLTFSTVVTGFWQGLVGLPPNQTRYVTVPASLGYDIVNQSCFVTRPLVTTVPLVAALSFPAFESEFPGINTSAGYEFTDPTYGWPDLILVSNTSSVVYENLPTLGSGTSPGGLPATVSAINSTTITVAYQLSPAQAGLVKGTSTSSVCSSSTFIVSQVDQKAGTYVADYNPEVYGQTLIFQVVVIDIFPPS
jgi:hypothetical protein